MPELKTVAFAYDAKEDRILAGINLGQADAWSCWLTRRLVLALLERAPRFVERTSTSAQQTPMEFRHDLVAFEREAALATTASSMRPADNAHMKGSAASAELADRLTISLQCDKFRLELKGNREGAAAGTIKRAQLQRILQMLSEEVTRASWLSPSAKGSSGDQAEVSAAKILRQ
jgi:hypothetical protein